MGRLANKNILITGGNSGIGLAGCNPVRSFPDAGLLRLSPRDQRAADH